MNALKIGFLLAFASLSIARASFEEVQLQPGSQTILVRALWPEGPCEIDSLRSFQANSYGATERFPEKLVSLTARFHATSESGWQPVEILGATEKNANAVKIEFLAPLASAQRLKTEWEASAKPQIFWITENKKCLDRKWMHLVRGLRVSRN